MENAFYQATTEPDRIGKAATFWVEHVFMVLQAGETK